MNDFFTKTLGGLDNKYYFRNFIFGLPFGVFFVYLTLNGGADVKDYYFKLIYTILSTILYPYAKYVYDSIRDFIMGDNILFTSLFLALILKYIVIALVWVFSIFIAPVGLIYLYFYHMKQEKLLNEESAHQVDKKDV